MTQRGQFPRRMGIALILLAVAVAVGPTLSCGGGEDGSEFPVIRNLSDFYAYYGANNPSFVTYETQDVIAFFQQRMVGEAIVQGDHLLYQFDQTTEVLVKERIRWDAQVPDALPPGLMSRAEAEALVGGPIASTRLYYVAPGSYVMPLDPVPQNPCWVCCGEACGGPGCVIVDAMQRVILGSSVPSPDTTAFAGTGPWYEDPCSGAWDTWRNNAATWFQTMGYDPDSVHWPTENEVQSHVQSASTAMFYEIGHSQHTPGLLFTSGCAGNLWEATTAVEVSTWIANYTKMPFTFLASCYAMSGTGIDTLSFAFRKGSLYNTAVVGFKEMGTPACEGPCWNFGYSFDWQNGLFEYMSQGYTVKDAFDMATLDYPSCAPCTGFVGDASFAVVPVVVRGWLLKKIDIVLMRIPEILDLPGPGPVSRVHLEDALAAAQAARDALQQGAPRDALLNARATVQSLESAEATGVPEAGEVVDTMVEGVDQHVSGALTDARYVVDPANPDLGRATNAHAAARSALDAGNNLAAIDLFLDAWDFLQLALAP